MSLVTLVCLWVPLVTVFYLVRWMRKVEDCGLVTGYVLNMIALHWVGGAIRLLPWFKDSTPIQTEAGLTEATYALIALFVGSLATPALVSYLAGRRQRAFFQYKSHSQLPHTYILLGIGSYVLLATFLSRLPSVAVVIITGQALYVVGLCLLAWNAKRRKSPVRLLVPMCLAMVLPMVTLVGQGFLGFGTSAAMVVFVFIGSFFSRWKMALITVLAAYLGLSVYVTYMRDRTQIRKIVWGGQSLSDRFDQVESTASHFEWLNLQSPEQLYRIDVRLNQNYLAGAGVVRLAFTNDFAHGKTIWEALEALVPRALWTDKPIASGSGDLVERYTGVRFAPGTSVGVGQVLEFYLNFGTTGVVIGFFLFGVVITKIDSMAREYLLAGNQQKFGVWLVAGMGMLQTSGSLVDVSGASIGGLLVVSFLNKYLLPDLQKRITPAPAPASLPEALEQAGVASA